MGKWWEKEGRRDFERREALTIDVVPEEMSVLAPRAAGVVGMGGSGGSLLIA